MARKPSSTIPTNMADPKGPPAAASRRPTKSKPKRVRRKCSHSGCANRVVQGGVCVTHGAKRKLCSEPGCDKAVKLAGFCSTHGPARRKCDHAGCTRVAVQGGRCLSHGARRRVCCYPVSKVGGKACTKNAIMGGMCKKHYDRVQDAEGMLEMSLCLPVGDSPPSMAAAGATTVDAAISVSVSGGSASSPLDDSDEDGGLVEVMPLSAPSWGSGIQAVPSTASMVSAMSEAPAAVTSAMPPARVNSAPGLAAAAGGGHKRRAKKMKKPSHQRGLSLFDDMPMVDAIIGNTGGAEPTKPPPPSSETQPPGYPIVRAPPEPPAPPVAVAAPPVLSVKYPQGSMSTKTPTPQVSFADCVVPSNRRAGGVPSAPTSAPRADGESPCTGCASCTCNACRSPTLAIFEQMIQASQIVEKGEQAKYATGWSPLPHHPPKLSSPRKASALLSARYAAGVGGQDLPTPGRTTPKNVSFLPEEPTSSGSVVRKVSSQNIVGDGGWEENASAAAAANDGGIPQDHQGMAQGYPLPLRNGYHQRAQEARGAEERPASHALAAMAARDDASVSRTVSHDLDDGRHQTYSSYFPNHQGSQPPLPPPAAPPQYSHRHAAMATYHQEPRGPPPPPQYPQGQGGYAVQYHQAPAPPPPREGPPQAPYYHHHHQYQATAPQAFYPPQTPALYDNSTPPPQQRDVSKASIVSSGSTHNRHCDQHLLPKRRESIAHLFIPKEV